MKNLLILLVGIPVMVTAQINIKKPAEVYDLLLGTWQYQSNPEYEAWSFDKTSKTYNATIFSVSKGDTTISEKCRIYKVKNTWYYEQMVVLHKDILPVTYQLTAMEKRMMKFENKNNTFPQTIMYEWMEDNTLKVTQSGMVNNKPESLEFMYHPMQ